MDARQFVATSGNRILHVTDFGPDGRHVAWDLKPSDKDREEFDEWAGMVGEIEVTRHNGGRRK